jgi:hypothetical protein
MMERKAQMARLNKADFMEAVDQLTSAQTRSALVMLMHAVSRIEFLLETQEDRLRACEDECGLSIEEDDDPDTEEELEDK